MTYVKEGTMICGNKKRQKRRSKREIGDREVKLKRIMYFCIYLEYAEN